MAETLTIRTASSTEVVKIAVPGPQGPAGAAGAAGPSNSLAIGTVTSGITASATITGTAPSQTLSLVLPKGDTGATGPQGPAGTGLETLTTKGDTLYRGETTGERLPIGTAGQILKVSASGIPEWGAAPATGVTSVTGTAPIASSGGNTPAISISEATTSAAGSMSAADKSKLDGIAAGATANSASSSTPSALGTAAAGSSSDYARADHVHSAEVSDSAFRVTGSTDATKKVAIEVDTNVPANTTVTLTAPSSGGTLALAGAAPTAHAASHAAGQADELFDQSLNQADTPTFAGVIAPSVLYPDGNGSGFSIQNGEFYDSGIVAAVWIGAEFGIEKPLNFTGPSATTDKSTTRTNLGLEIGTDVAAASHTHGNITNDGKVGSTAGLPLKTGTAGAVEAGAFGTSAGEFAEGNHTHTQLHDKSHTMTDATSHTAGNHKVFYSNGSGEIVELALGNSGEVLTSNGATSAPSFAAASGGDTVSIDASAADVLTATSGAISADDGGTIDSSDPFIKWDDTAGKLVYANPLSRPSGAFYVGLAPTTTALGSNAVNIQPARAAATQVASGGDGPVAIGQNTTAGNQGGVAVGQGANAGVAAVAIGRSASATGADATAVGNGASATANNATSLGRGANASQANSTALGQGSVASAQRATAVGTAVSANLRSQFATQPFQSIYWGGETTNDTPLILNLDAAATNRFTIAANTALAVDILLVARRSDVADKWLVARRFLGIRRDGSNNTSLIGSVQTLGTDQSEGSPSWSFTLTADDTNEALQLEVTGAASETVQWRATAFYRVV